MLTSLRYSLLCLLVLAAMCGYSQTPTITSFSPATGPVGTLVTINGTNLSTPTAFTIGGQSAIAVSNTGSVLVGMVMPNAVTGTVSITTAGGTASGTGNFTVIATKFPSVQQGNKLVGTTDTGPAIQGCSVSVSGDGNTAIVGGRGDNTNIGAAWVYTRSGGTWTQQGAKLLATDAVGPAQEGIAVALSADGNTAIVGGNGDNSFLGAAWIFTRSGGVLTQQGAKLVGTGSIGNAQQGFSVSMSADGNTAIVGGNADNSNAGAAWIFTRSSGAWTQQGSKLVGTGSVGAAQQGCSVSVSADGNTAMIGGQNDNSNRGAAWVFTRSGGAWTQQGSKLLGTGAGGTALAMQGSSVSLSADGNTALIGGDADASNEGAVWVFTRSGGAWTQQGAKLVGTGGTGSVIRQGCSVSLSADGNTAIVGGFGDNFTRGAAWIYNRVGGAWTQQGAKIAGSDNVGAAEQGFSVSMSADGNTAIEGGFVDNSDVGAAWVFISGLTENPPTVQATAVTFTNTTATTTTVNWTNGNGASRAVFLGLTSTGSPAPVNGTNYNANSNYHIAAEVGTSPWFCIYNGTGSTVNITDLNLVTTYRVMVVEYNAITGFQDYLTTTGTGNPGNFTTPSNNALLNSIALTPSSVLTNTGTVGSTTTYTTSVGNATASVTVTPTAIDANAAIQVNGTTVVSGTASAPVPLAEGATTTINTVVNAQDGTTTHTYSITVTRAPSNNALLHTIALSAFSTLTNTGTTGTTTTYTASIGSGIASVIVTPTAEDANATIKVNGTVVTSGTASGVIALPGGPGSTNTLTIVVTAQDGTTTHTYSVAVTCGVLSDALLSTLALSPASAVLKTGTSGSTTTYTASVGSAVTSVTVTPTTEDPGATVKVNGTTVASGTASGPIAITGGTTTTITVVVTAQDGTTTRTYSISVTGDAMLSSIALTPSSVLTNTGTTGNTTTFTASVSNATASVTVTPTTADPTATVKVNGTTVASGTASGAIALAEGTATTINTVVTAQGGTTTRTYSITITRAGSSNALLSSIKLTPSSVLTNTGTSGSTTTYTASVSNATASVTVTPTTIDANATVKVNGIAVTSGTASGSIALAEGISTTITTVVTAQNGTTIRTYSIVVTRAPSANALLSTIKLTPSSVLVNTGTTGSTTSYTSAVPNTETSLEIIPTTVEANATVKVNGVTVASGTASGSIALAVGSNTINVVATAQDGTTTWTYSIIVTRASGPLMSLYLPISVVQPTDIAAIENDGVMVHQGVSPNGDGINDVLSIDGIIAYPDNSLQIIDRSGTLIYQAKGYNNIGNVFDGHSSINGRMQQPGTYFYSLDYVAAGQNKHKTGYIILRY